MVLIAASIATAWAIVRFGAVEYLLAQTGDGVLLTSFIAGMFFTSILTTAPAMAVLAELGIAGSLPLVALVGGAGAVVGDLFIFLFVRDRLTEDIAYLLGKAGASRYLKLFHRKTFRWLLPFVGGLIIASPLPDEFGLTLLGMTKMRTSRFVPLSFAFNTVGILLIGLVARVLA